MTLLGIGLAVVASVVLTPKAVLADPVSSQTPQGNCIGGSLVSSPNAGAYDNSLLGVSAVSADDVWAVGHYISGSVHQTLTMHWNGTQWSIVNSPNVASLGNYLYGVVAVSSNDVWAVGYYTGGPNRTLTMHWNGTQWSIVGSPNANSLNNSLAGVAAVSANDIWAVGYYYGSSNADQTLTMHWNGTQWTIVSSPNPGSSINRLFAVTAISANDVWAVGNYSIPVSGTFRTLTEHWNGTQWSVVSSPNPGLDYNVIIGVTATAANDAWAVGFYTDGRSRPRQTLTIHWDGTQWNSVGSPNSSLDNNYLYGVTAISSDDAWAVGYSYNTVGNTPSQALALHWNGTQWGIVGSPNPGSTTNTLKAVAAISRNSALAVGIYQSGYTNPLQTLALAYADQCSTPTATTTAVAPTGTPTRSNTPVMSVTPTATTCPMNFSDVLPIDYFYESIRYLYCADIISGYGDGTFRPFNSTTRGQLTKIVVLARGWSLDDCPSTGHFSDVAPDSAFFCYIETAYSRDIISGYGDGTFRPDNNVTRGQLSKVVVLSMDWTDPCPSTGHFTDVPPGNPFFCFVETAYEHSVISGYSDGTFRPDNSATRGQIAKIVYEAITNP